ncbi:thioredoxin [Chloroherpeton thalassium ATCC 35110]|uniref:Thioredoxin n=1 Tax=Chloroherpeton thalassium (strain ATCC 35110 / GB-78) TaxID=517418 RepID=B3QSW7_CHLT3|nr:thioredoxin family protein [Chloroherpeton thalassium]ACF12610.1 thioredoxin [Chloroherpeton thalassium ATCC 35110]
MAELVLCVFTHPACPRCPAAVEMAWRLSEEFRDMKLKTVKLENKEGLSFAQKLHVKTIPTMIFFKNGKEEKRFVGLPKPEELKAEFVRLSDTET